jgi:hypothetical protein
LYRRPPRPERQLALILLRRCTLLATAKFQRASAALAWEKAAFAAVGIEGDVPACEKLVQTLSQRREIAIACAQPDAVVAIDSELLRARVGLEIAASKAATSDANHASAWTALCNAKTEVERCARAVIDSKMISLAAKVTSALDDAVALGAQLQALSTTNFLNTPLNAAVRSVPVEVSRALERLPKRNPYDIPVNELRDGASGNAWQKLFAELTADDEPKSIAA